MYRFFVDKKNNNMFELDDEIINHLKSIRLKQNEKFYCIYENEYYLCHLESNNLAIIEQKCDINNEFDFNVVLFASIINIKRFEWLIQKAAELGTKHFYPIITKNTNIKYIDLVKSKIERFNQISKNACEQSFRNQIMEVHNPINFIESINYEIENKYIAHEQIKDKQKDNFFFENDVAFYVGPEGGFDNEEINSATSKNIKVVSLGKKILRAETASIFLLSRIKN